jgi:hypothetical protein
MGLMMQNDTLRCPKMPFSIPFKPAWLMGLGYQGISGYLYLHKMENIHMDTNTHPDTHLYKKVMQLDALDTLDTLMPDDDRVTCQTCANTCEAEEDEFVDLAKAEHMKRMGKKIGFDGDKIEQRGKWLKVSWIEKQCTIKKIPCLPHDLKHRCDYFQPFNEVAIENATKEWWEQ